MKKENEESVDEVENSTVPLAEKGYSSRKFGGKVGVCHRTVLLIIKKRNINQPKNRGGRPRDLSDSDARLMERSLRKNESKTPKAAVLALNKKVSDGQHVEH